jgi:SAM-dependent methyltransferase
VVKHFEEAQPDVSRLGALYHRIYSALCGAHPQYRLWHFQYLFLAELHPWQRQRMADLKGHVLDVGCGTRPYEAWAGSAPGDITAYTGLDVAPDAKVDIVVGPGAPWPLPAGSIDAVLLTQVLEHVADRAYLIGEIARVLRPGGTLLLTVPFIFPVHGLPHDYARFTAAGIRSLFEANFEIVELHGVGHAGSAIGNLLLTFIDSSLNASRATRLLKGALLPLWLPFCLAVNLVCRGIDRIDDTDAYYTNVAMIAHRRAA